MSDVIFPASLALQALRSSSYKDTAHAVAELVDNSVDAGAKQVGVALLVNKSNEQPIAIAVLDNGKGMSKDVLMKCIQYGYSPQEAQGIRNRRGFGRLGKYGVGLVAASFSQCDDLQAWSWQNGEAKKGETLSTRIRVPDSGEMRAEDNLLPTPEVRKFPEWTSGAFVGMASPPSFLNSGTLIVWKGVEATWKKPETLRKHLSDLCGRIYRDIIGVRLDIIINVYNIEDEKTIGEREFVHSIDPLFLKNWNDPALEKWGFSGDETLFVPYTGHLGDSGRNQVGDYQPEWHDVEFGGQTVGHYLIMASHRNPRVVQREDLREQYRDPGDAPYGKLAKKLQGVSIMRSGREISLDPNWLRVSLTVDRWISVSIDFDPDLDDVFGVSNDKQSANRLASCASMSIKDIQDKIGELKKDDDRDERELECLKTAQKIKQLLSEMQQIIARQRKGERTIDDAESQETRDPSRASNAELTKTGERLASGSHRLPYDNIRPKDHPEGTRRVYEGSTSDGDPAEDVRPDVVMRQNLKIDAVMDEHDQSSKIFRVSKAPGHLVVHLIAHHPLSRVLSRLLTPVEELQEGDEKPTLRDAVRTLRTLLISYARAQVEGNEESKRLGAEFERCAQSWGEVAERVFTDEDDL